MDRRDFLRAATSPVATGYLLDSATALAEPNRPWREYLAAPARHSRVPHVSYAGARFRHRTVDVPGARAHAIRPEEHTPLGAMVGVRDTGGPTDHSRDRTDDPSAVVDAPDERVWPSNLYAAQPRRRLR